MAGVSGAASQTPDVGPQRAVAVRDEAGEAAEQTSDANTVSPHRTGVLEALSRATTPIRETAAKLFTGLLWRDRAVLGLKRSLERADDEDEADARAPGRPADGVAPTPDVCEQRGSKRARIREASPTFGLCTNSVEGMVDAGIAAERDNPANSVAMRKEERQAAAAGDEAASPATTNPLLQARHSHAQLPAVHIPSPGTTAALLHASAFPVARTLWDSTRRPPAGRAPPGGDSPYSRVEQMFRSRPPLWGGNAPAALGAPASAAAEIAPAASLSAPRNGRAALPALEAPAAGPHEALGLHAGSKVARPFSGQTPFADSAAAADGSASRPKPLAAPVLTQRQDPRLFGRQLLPRPANGAAGATAGAAGLDWAPSAVEPTAALLVQRRTAALRSIRSVEEQRNGRLRAQQAAVRRMGGARTRAVATEQGSIRAGGRLLARGNADEERRASETAQKILGALESHAKRMRGGLGPKDLAQSVPRLPDTGAVVERTPARVGPLADTGVGGAAAAAAPGGPVRPAHDGAVARFTFQKLPPGCPVAPGVQGPAPEVPVVASTRTFTFELGRPADGGAGSRGEGRLAATREAAGRAACVLTCAASPPASVAEEPSAAVVAPAPRRAATRPVSTTVGMAAAGTGQPGLAAPRFATPCEALREMAAENDANDGEPGAAGKGQQADAAPARTLSNASDAAGGEPSFAGTVAAAGMAAAAAASSGLAALGPGGTTTTSGASTCAYAGINVDTLTEPAATKRPSLSLFAPLPAATGGRDAAAASGPTVESPSFAGQLPGRRVAAQPAVTSGALSGPPVTTGAHMRDAPTGPDRSVPPLVPASLFAPTSAAAVSLPAVSASAASPPPFTFGKAPASSPLSGSPLAGFVFKAADGGGKEGPAAGTQPDASEGEGGGVAREPDKTDKARVGEAGGSFGLDLPALGRGSGEGGFGGAGGPALKRAAPAPAESGGPGEARTGVPGGAGGDGAAAAQVSAAATSAPFGLGFTFGAPAGSGEGSVERAAAGATKAQSLFPASGSGGAGGATGVATGGLLFGAGGPVADTAAPAGGRPQGSLLPAPAAAGASTAGAAASDGRASLFSLAGIGTGGSAVAAGASDAPARGPAAPPGASLSDSQPATTAAAADGAALAPGGGSLGEIRRGQTGLFGSVSPSPAAASSPAVGSTLFAAGGASAASGAGFSFGGAPAASNPFGSGAAGPVGGPATPSFTFGDGGGFKGFGAAAAPGAAAPQPAFGAAAAAEPGLAAFGQQAAPGGGLFSSAPGTPSFGAPASFGAAPGSLLQGAAPVLGSQQAGNATAPGGVPGAGSPFGSSLLQGQPGFAPLGGSSPAADGGAAGGAGQFAFGGAAAGAAGQFAFGGAPAAGATGPPGGAAGGVGMGGLAGAAGGTSPFGGSSDAFSMGAQDAKRSRRSILQKRGRK